MLPSLNALSLGAPTGANDDVVTEIRDEQVEADKRAWEAWHEEQRMEEELAPVIEKLRTQEEALRAQERAIRQRWWADRHAAPVRKEVFDNQDLVKEVLLAVEQGGNYEDVCKLVFRWCSLNRTNRDACNDRLWKEVGERILGKEEWARLWMIRPPRRRFRDMCNTLKMLREGQPLRKTDEEAAVKAYVLAWIAGGDPLVVLQRTSDELRDDEDVVRAAVAKDARAIRFASPRLQALINPLRPTVFWPPDPAMETEFIRRWGDAVLHTLLYEDWDQLTIKKIRTQLVNEHPEVGPDYFRVTHRDEFRGLVDVLMLHIREHISTSQLRRLGY